MDKLCIRCNKPMLGRIRNNTKYCSIQCGNEAKAKARIVKKPIKQCKNCDCLFTPTRSSKEKNADGYSSFCTKKCYHQYQAKDKITYICECCNADFKWSKSRQTTNNIRFCSAACQGNFMTKERATNWKGGQYVCEISGDVMVMLESRSLKENKNNVYKALKRVVAEREIGRKLDKSECVIHVDGNKLNNDPKNLFICGIGLTRSIFRFKTQPLPVKGNLDTYR